MFDVQFVCVCVDNISRVQFSLVRVVDYLSDLFALALLDTPPFLFFATESKVIKAEDSSDSTGFEQWRSAQELDIAGVTALDVDISENKLYWINSVEKVSAPSNVAMHVHVARF